MVHVKKASKIIQNSWCSMRDTRDPMLSKRRRISKSVLNAKSCQPSLASPISTLNSLTFDFQKKTIESIEIEDIFTKLMGFFVTPNFIDVDSVSSVLYVSKLWNDLSTRDVVWKYTLRSQIIPRKRHLQNPLELISDRLIKFRNLGQLNDSETLTTNGVTFLVSERGTGLTYRLKVQHLEQSIGEEQRVEGQHTHDNFQDEDNLSTSRSIHFGADFRCRSILPSSTFREIRAMEKLSAHYEVLTDKNPNLRPCLVSTLKQWDVVHGYLYRWYDHTETTMTLSDYINEKQILSSGDVKSIMSKILLGVQDIHNCGLIHCNLTAETIWVSTLQCDEQVIINNEIGGENEVLIKIGDFEHCSTELSANEEVYSDFQNEDGISDGSGDLTGHQAPEILNGSSSRINGMPVDMWAVGCIFAKLLTLSNEYQKNRINCTMDVSKLLSFLTTSSNGRGEESGAKGSDYDDFSSLSNLLIGREEFNLLKRFICYNPSDRITASEALNQLRDHSFSNYITTGKGATLDRGHQYQKISSWEDAITASLDEVAQKNEINLRPDQHAILVDWLFEIITVFEKNASTCFLAIDILKLYCANSKVRIFFLSTINLLFMSQLISHYL